MGVEGKKVLCPLQPAVDHSRWTTRSDKSPRQLVLTRAPDDDAPKRPIEKEIPVAFAGSRGKKSGGLAYHPCAEQHAHTMGKRSGPRM